MTRPIYPAPTSDPVVPAGCQGAATAGGRLASSPGLLSRDDREPFKVIAVVSMNRGEAFVLNRAPKPLYEFDGRDLIGRDGPFVDILRYERPSAGFEAFGGREFDIPMADGSTVRAAGQYWAAGLKGTVSTAWGTLDGLKKCYVFNSGAWDEAARDELRASHTGEVYPYWAYEAFINFRDLRVAVHRNKHKAERDKEHVIRNLRAIKAERDELRARVATHKVSRDDSATSSRAVQSSACEATSSQLRRSGATDTGYGAPWAQQGIHDEIARVRWLDAVAAARTGGHETPEPEPAQVSQWWLRRAPIWGGLALGMTLAALALI